MLFSATLNATVKNLAWEYTIEAKEITIEAENVTVDEIDPAPLPRVEQTKKNAAAPWPPQERKPRKPDRVLQYQAHERNRPRSGSRSTATKPTSSSATCPRPKRLQVIDSFKSGSLKMLVATDVAARGIDVDSLAMVINYDLPNEAENYVHRIGRTARAGKTGKAYSFCSEQDVYNLPAIEKYCESKLPTCVSRRG